MNNESRVAIPPIATRDHPPYLGNRAVACEAVASCVPSRQPLGTRCVRKCKLWYATWSKAGQERFYGRLEDQHGKTYATYTGNSPANKPECVEDIKTGRVGHVNDKLRLINESIVPTMAESRKRLGGWLDIYHRTAHRSLSGATPLAVWQTATSLRRAADDELTCLLETRGVYKVGGNGVRFKVGSASIGYGKGCTALRQYVGRSVLILLNPDDISHVWAFTAERGKRRPIARLEANRRIAPNTCADDAREAIAETMRERSVMHKSRRASARRTLTQEQRINEHSRAVRAELLAQTGTDAVDATILPVRTGFEAGSRALRAASEPPPNEPPDLNDINDLFDATAHDESVEIDDDGGMEDLFASDNDTDVFDDEDGLESLL